MRSVDAAIALFGELGYTATARPLDLADVALPGVDRAVYLRSDFQRRRRGYGLLIGETAERPRSLRALARAVRDHVHDRPLAVLGVTGDGGAWQRMIVFRPQSRTTGGGISVTKLEIDVMRPSQHDAAVLGALAWRGVDAHETRPSPPLASRRPRHR